MLLEVNGKYSIPNKIKHIKTRYLFIKDIIEQGSVEFE